MAGQRPTSATPAHYRCLTCSLVVEASRRYGMCPGQTETNATNHVWAPVEDRASEAIPNARLDAYEAYAKGSYGACRPDIAELVAEVRRLRAERSTDYDQSEAAFRAGWQAAFDAFANAFGDATPKNPDDAVAAWRSPKRSNST